METETTSADIAEPVDSAERLQADLVAAINAVDPLVSTGVLAPARSGAETLSLDTRSQLLDGGISMWVLIESWHMDRRIWLRTKTIGPCTDSITWSRVPWQYDIDKLAREAAAAWETVRRSSDQSNDS